MTEVRKRHNNVESLAYYEEGPYGSLEFEYAFLVTPERKCFIMEGLDNTCSITLFKAKVDGWGQRWYNQTKSYQNLTKIEAWTMFSKKAKEYGYDCNKAVEVKEEYQGR